MAQYLLDTNVLISMFRNKGKVRKHILEVGFPNCYVSEISIAELFYGAAKGGRKQNFEDVNNVLRQFEVLPIYSCLENYGHIKALLERQGQRIDDFDLLIVATALQKGLVMVTANVGHLARIPDLVVENWE
mgnify:FL=1